MAPANVPGWLRAQMPTLDYGIEFLNASIGESDVRPTSPVL
jgi:hypothetical protein